MEKILLQENVYAIITDEGTLIIENVAEGPLSQDRIRCIGLSPVGSQNLLSLLVNNQLVEQPLAPDVQPMCPTCKDTRSVEYPCPNCRSSKTASIG